MLRRSHGYEENHKTFEEFRKCGNKKYILGSGHLNVFFRRNKLKSWFFTRDGRVDRPLNYPGTGPIIAVDPTGRRYKSSIDVSYYYAFYANTSLYVTCLFSISVTIILLYIHISITSSN